MTLVANDYRRLGAHAANIARRVAYLAGPVAGWCFRRVAAIYGVVSVLGSVAWLAVWCRRVRNAAAHSMVSPTVCPARWA
jgi:hypothetical protein